MHQFKGDGEGVLVFTLFDHIQRIKRRTAFMKTMDEEYNRSHELGDDNVDYPKLYLERRKRVIQLCFTRILKIK